MSIRTIVVAILVISHLSSSANIAATFEMDGFKTGMSVDEAQAVARGNGYSLVNRKDDKWTVFETSLSTRHRLSFCGEQLVAYFKPLEDLAAFIRALSQRTREFGKADYNSHGYDSVFSGGVQTLNMFWRDGTETFGLQAEQWDETQYFMMLWSSENNCRDR